MSTGLGDTQRRALYVLGDGQGWTIAALAAEVDITPRRCRALVASLVERKLVIVKTDRGVGHVWLARYWLRAERVQEMRNWKPRATARTCPTCGHRLRTAANL